MSGVRVWVALALLVAAPGTSAAKGVRGVTPDGEKGWLHTVDPGDTLWDISETYLGSPWIWPSLWRENAIDNPHVIEPGSLIWITERHIRRLSADEAQRISLLGETEPGAPVPADGSLDAVPAPARAPAAAANDPFAALDRSGSELRTALTFPGLHRFGFVTPEELHGSAAVLGSHDENYWASQERRTIVGIGEGRVHVGDRFTVFRTRKRVDHPETGVTLGYLIEQLGTADVMEIHTESSFVKVTRSYAEIQPGDRLVPYVEPPVEFRAVELERDVEGMVVGVQLFRQFALRGDVVLIDRGSEDGVLTGGLFEIYRGGKEVLDPVTAAKTLVPDDVIGRLMVLQPGRGTSLALLLAATRPVHQGDRIRTL